MYHIYCLYIILGIYWLYADLTEIRYGSLYFLCALNSIRLIGFNLPVLETCFIESSVSMLGEKTSSPIPSVSTFILEQNKLGHKLTRSHTHTHTHWHTAPSTHILTHVQSATLTMAQIATWRHTLAHRNARCSHITLTNMHIIEPHIRRSWPNLVKLMFDVSVRCFNIFPCHLLFSYIWKQQQKANLISPLWNFDIKF